MIPNEIDLFLEVLASKEPVPGGGGASALIGALSAALCTMVANLTSGKKKYAEYQKDMERIIASTETSRKELLEFIEKDAKAFYPLSQAYSIPKDDPKREEVLEAALKDAASTPLELLYELDKLVYTIEELTCKGSKIAVSDVAVAAAALEAAVKGAAVNVYINTKLMHDTEYADEQNRLAYRIVKHASKVCSRVYDEIKEKDLMPKKAEPDNAAGVCARELRGMPVVNALNEDFKQRVGALADKGIVPKLVVIRVGAREDDLSYEKGIKKRFENAGAEFEIVELEENVSQEVLETTVKKLNEDCLVHGIMLFRPLPKSLSEERIKGIILPEKDVDCMSLINTAYVFAGDKRAYPPCTAQAVVELLKHYQIPLAGSRVVIVGRSMVVGKPLAMLLMSENATVTVCHTKTKNLAEECKKADVIVACAGAAKMITAEHVREGQTVIDVGINVSDGKLCGDVDFEQVSRLTSAVTPVPGGVGNVTTAVLLKHTIMSAEKTIK